MLQPRTVSRTAAIKAPVAAYWSGTEEAALREVESRRDGLSAAEAAMRLTRDGPNSVSDERIASWLSLLLHQFASPLVLILVFAAVVAGIVQEWLDAAIILAIVLGSTLLSFAQEYRASAAVAELRQRLALTTRVRRDGQVVSAPFADVVRGDVILLSAGAVIPADGFVLSATDLLVSEAALTGESFPVEKRPGSLAVATPLAQRTNSVFLGTSVRSGTAEVVVMATGRRTQFGAIADRLTAKPIESDFAQSVRRFGAMLIRVMIVVVLFVLTANQLLGRPFLDSLLFAVALGVGLSPELLPAVVSVTLAAGARSLARSGVLVRHLEAIENLGSMTVLCTDKTGTLTEGEIVLTAAVDAAGRPSRSVEQLAYINAAFETGIENPLDQAIVAAGAAASLSTEGYAKVDEIPYDFIRKRLTIVVQPSNQQDQRLIITKGAFINVLPLCATYLAADGHESALDTVSRAKIEADYQARSEQGFRVLALATRRIGVKPDYVMADEAEMCFAGLLIFADPPKPESGAAIRDLASLGVAVKVISGDNRHVVASVARALGLEAATLLTGPDIAAMKDEALWNLAQRTTLFAEIDPQQKERIIRALQRSGQSVGYLGDGINDAPALYAADVGISVQNAVDVARESADVVLLRRDLGVIRQGVEGGRRTFANTLKYICITISANFGNMISMAVATPLLPFLPMAATQILLNNFMSDLPAMAISSDAVDAPQLASSQRLRVADIQLFMIVFGLISSVFDLITFAALLLVFRTGEAAFQTSWFVESLLTELAVVLVLRTHGPAWKSQPGQLLLWITTGVSLLALVAPYLGPVSSIFGFTPLPLPLLTSLVAIALGYVLATEAAKLWFYGRLKQKQAPLI